VIYKPKSKAYFKGKDIVANGLGLTGYISPDGHWIEWFDGTVLVSEESYNNRNRIDWSNWGMTKATGHVRTNSLLSCKIRLQKCHDCSPRS